jgi:hypothetical protein
VLSPKAFHPNASYQFLIDGNDDAKPDTTIEIDFGKLKNGKQEVELELEGPSGEAEAEGKTGQDIEINIEAGDNDDRGEDNDDEGEENDNEGGGILHAGLFDDPFFFDLANFNLGAKFCGAAGGVPVDNFFEGLNVSAIVVEVPSSLLGDNTIGVWARTVMGGTQIDRMGRPAINTVFIPPNPFEAGSTLPGNPEDAFNAGKPKNDQANFRGEVVNSLTLLFSLNDATDPNTGDDAGTIQALADILLPDILTIDTSNPGGFLNGRQLADDVIDAELGIITEGLITGDCVINDSAFPGSFPYLALKN